MHLEEKKENESFKETLFEKQLKRLQERPAAESDTHKREIQMSSNEALNIAPSFNFPGQGRPLTSRTRLKSANQKLTTELASCKNDAKTELNKMIKKLQNDIKMEKARTQSVEQQLKEMLTSATAEKNDLKCTNIKLEEKVKKTEQSIELLQSEIYDLQQQIAETQTQDDELRRENLEIGQLAELESNKQKIQNLKYDLKNNQSLRKLNEMYLQYKLHDNSTSLVIQDRKINYVAPGTFDNLSSFTHLNFSWSGLTFLENGVFNNLTNLITLDLSENYLTCLDGYVFSGLKKLKRIYLFNNKFTRLPPQLFRGLESLEEIYLSYSKIAVFDEDLLVGLNQLTRFDADNNNLTSIPEKLFKDCVKLEKVLLQNNKIEIVLAKKTIFDSLHNLKLLRLHNNALNDMNKNALRMLKINSLTI